MSVKGDRAVELFKQGYNCSQAVLGAFAEDLGLDLDIAMKISQSFGGGMGRMREVCGALTGEFMVAGLIWGNNSTDSTLKGKHYKLIQSIANDFKESNGSIICRDLLGLGNSISPPTPDNRTDTYYKKRPCVELVRLCAIHMEELMDKTNTVD